MTKPVVIIGYSGHGLVVAEVLRCAGIEIMGYCDISEKTYNPFNIRYLGPEDVFFDSAIDCQFIVAIGDNSIRRRVQEKLEAKKYRAANAVHPSAVIGADVHLGAGILICPNVVINPAVHIADGAILNTNVVIEHECSVGGYCHIAPGTVLCGNVQIDQNTFVGAQSVIIQGLTIGSGVTIGAGSVVIHSIEQGSRVAGNPARDISQV